MGLIIAGMILTLLHAIYLANIKHIIDLSVAYDYFSPGIMLTSIGFFNLLRGIADQIDHTLSKSMRTLISLISTFSLGIYHPLCCYGFVVGDLLAIFNYWPLSKCSNHPTHFTSDSLSY